MGACAIGTMLLATTGVRTEIVLASDLRDRAAASEVFAGYREGQRESQASIFAALEQTEARIRRCTTGVAWLQVPLGKLRGDPFTFGGSESPIQDAGKNADDSADADRIKVLAALEKIQVQSIVGGEHPSCLIDNRLYAEGEQIACFTIERIGADGVVLRDGAYRFQLKAAG